MKRLICAVLTLCYCLTPQVFSAVYQWQDQHGRTHFSDQKPQQEKYTLKAEAQSVAFEDLLPERGQRLIKNLVHGDYYQYLPKQLNRQSPIVVVAHGMFPDSETAKDAAWNTSRRWQRFAEKHNSIIVAPVFDNYRYAATRGGPQKWGYRGLFGRDVGADQFLHEIIAVYQRHNSDYDGRFYLFGHSAGAQFANRYLVRHPDRVIATALSAPAWFALPTAELPWPNGMGQRSRVIRWPGQLTDKRINITPEPSGWLKANQRPVLVAVGELDTQLIRHVSGVGGDNHVTRAEFYVDSMHQFARESFINSQIELQIVPDVGHNFGKLAQICQDYFSPLLMEKANSPQNR